MKISNAAKYAINLTRLIIREQGFDYLPYDMRAIAEEMAKEIDMPVEEIYKALSNEDISEDRELVDALIGKVENPEDYI